MTGIAELNQLLKEDTAHHKTVEIIFKALKNPDFSAYDCGTLFIIFSRSQNIRWKHLTSPVQNLITETVKKHFPQITADESIHIIEGLVNLEVQFDNNNEIYKYALYSLEYTIEFLEVSDILNLLNILSKAKIRLHNLSKKIQDELIYHIKYKIAYFDKSTLFYIYDFLYGIKFSNKFHINLNKILFNSIRISADKFNVNEFIQTWSLLESFKIAWYNVPKYTQFSFFDALERLKNNFCNNDYNLFFNSLKYFNITWDILSPQQQISLGNCIATYIEKLNSKDIQILISLLKTLKLKSNFIPKFDLKLFKCLEANVANCNPAEILDIFYTLTLHEVEWPDIQQLHRHLLGAVENNIRLFNSEEILSIIVSASKFDIDWNTNSALYRKLLDKFDQIQKSLSENMMANILLAFAHMGALTIQRLEKTILKNYKHVCNNMLVLTEYRKQFNNKASIKIYTALCYLELDLKKDNTAIPEYFNELKMIFAQNCEYDFNTTTISFNQKEITGIIKEFYPDDRKVFIEIRIECMLSDILILRNNSEKPLIIEVNGPSHLKPKTYDYNLSTKRKIDFLIRSGYDVTTINLQKDWDNKDLYSKKEFIRNLLIQNNVIFDNSLSIDNRISFETSVLFSSQSQPSNIPSFNSSIITNYNYQAANISFNLKP